VDVVRNGKCVTIGAGGIDAILEVILRSLYLLLGQLVVVVCVQVKRGDHVAERSHVCLACSGVACRVRGSHVGGVFSDDVADSHLILYHLIITLILGDLVKILVGPGVTGNLVALGVHVGNNAAPVLVDCTLAIVIASNEESGLRVLCSELRHDLLSVDIWAVVIGDGNGLGLQALADTDATICDSAELGASIILSGCSDRGLVSIAAWPKVDLAVRCGAVVLGDTAVSLE
jgi:hypothetical protein